jgi:hypothetical protein
MTLRLFISILLLPWSVLAQQPKAVTPAPANREILWEFDTGG